MSLYSDGLCIFSATGTAVVTSVGVSSEVALESPDGLISRNIGIHVYMSYENK